MVPLGLVQNFVNKSVVQNYFIQNVFYIITFTPLLGKLYRE